VKNVPLIPHGGTGIGIPFHLGDSGRKEVRLGVGVEWGLFDFSSKVNGGNEDECYSDGNCYSSQLYFEGTIPVVELLYSVHLRPRLGIEAGVSAYVFIPMTVDRVDEMDDGYPDTNIWVTPNVFLFFGITV